ncbi:hypothetical protein V5799_009891 [Amblyomma americanum]|uniref:Ran gtpase-activating protein n=1 Tax=Amblyomma americanum TaxID=6943 RepID=A0AAQ4FAC0_AMBAM
MHSEAAFLISWLVEHHSCIDALGIKSTVSADEAPACLRLRRPPGKGIRCLDIVFCNGEDPRFHLAKEDTDALRGLQRLHISDAIAMVESRVVTLLRNNSSSLRFVQLSCSNLSQSVQDALQCLEKCESVSVSDCSSDDGATESNTLTAMLRSMAALKTLRFSGHYNEDWNFSAISAALKANVILRALVLTADCVNDSSSIIEFFAAIEVNKSVRTLRVEFDAIKASCATSIASALFRNTCLLELQLAACYLDDHCLILMAEALSQNTTLKNLDVSEVNFGVSGFYALCDALRTNKTLQELVLPEFEAPKAQRCGLISELQSWNRVLYGLNYELTETCLGKLSLRYVPHGPVEKCRANAASMHSEAAFLISWLVEHHSCIDDLGIKTTVSADEAPACLRLRRPAGKDIRCLDIALCNAEDPMFYLAEEDVDALRGIERLHISDGIVMVESRVVTLLRNNSSSLRIVRLSYSNLSQGVQDALQCLKKCESVFVSHCSSNDCAIESNTLGAMLRSNTSLKTITFSGHYSEDWSFCAISAALKANVTLMALDLTADCVNDSSSIIEFFAAIEVNNSVRTLRVEFDVIEVSCGTSIASALSRNTCLLELELVACFLDDHCLILMAEALSQNTTLENLDVSEASFGVSGFYALCDALCTNKTLQELVLPEFDAPKAQRCGLISELQSWNRVLYGLNYELAETCPGKLSLRYAPHDPVEKCRKKAASMHSEAAFLISWLVEHHSCIDELGIKSTVSADEPCAPLRLHRPPEKGIRCLEITLCDAEDPRLYLAEEHVDALRGIEQLHISDGIAMVESRVVTLLRNNSSSLRIVQLSYSNLSQGVQDALQCLEKCESVTVSDCSSDDCATESNTLTAMLRSMAALKTLRFSGHYEEEWNFSQISAALKANVTLTTLDLAADCVNESSSIIEFFAGLEVNNSVRTLRVKFDTIDACCGASMASALCRNTCLVDLHLAAWYLDDHCLIVMAEALSQNTTLENFDLREARFGLSGFSVLCDALRTNKTLKELLLPEFAAPEVQRPALSEKLAHGDGYRRVLRPFLDECDLQALSTRLACPTICPEEITGIVICNISEATLKHFFDALASSSYVQVFTVSILKNPQAKIELLCEMLMANRSISSFGITIAQDSGGIIQQLLNAIEVNKYISELRISISDAGMNAAIALRNFIARNRTITTLTLYIEGLNRQVLIKGLSQAMLMNPTIMKLGGAAWESMSYTILEALQRNQAALNRAIDFVLGSRESQCAEAFELFSRTPCLVELVMEASGQNEFEALQAIASAKKFLRDNNLDIKDRSSMRYPGVGGIN